MNQAVLIATLACSALTVLTTIGAAVFVYARLTMRVDVNTEAIDELRTTTETHNGEIGVLYGHLRLTR
jgi:hypothetical protein